MTATVDPEGFFIGSFNAVNGVVEGKERWLYRNLSTCG
jgi:hypothetical protein